MPITSRLSQAIILCRDSHARFGIKPRMTIFNENYRVVAVESQSLVIRGIVSGNVLIINAVPECPLRKEAFPAGQLIRLIDPSVAAPD